MAYTDKNWDSIIAFLNELSLRHEVHKFPSGFIMIDVWIGDEFYVLQLGENEFGVSKLDKGNPGFDSIPDEQFKYFEDFEKRVMSIFKQ